MPGVEVVNGGPLGDLHLGFIRSGMLTASLFVEDVPVEDKNGKVLDVVKGKGMGWQEIDPDSQTGLEQLTMSLLPDIDKTVDSCHQ